MPKETQTWSQHDQIGQLLLLFFAVIHEWLFTLESRKGLQKAFDNVPHQPLLDMQKRLGSNNYIIRWITSYLTCRSQRIVVNGETSQRAHVVSGVPQGLVLGPLLFIIYINDLAMCSYCPGSKLIMYADDVLLYRTIFSIADFDALQVDLDTIKVGLLTTFWNLNVNI